MNFAKKIIDLLYNDDAYAARIAPDIWPMAINKEQGIYLTRLIDRVKPGSFVELGFRYGISSLWIQSASHKPRIHVIVDPYHHIPHPPKKSTIDDFIKKQKGVLFVEDMTSQEYLATLSHKKAQVDMVFIDASQWFDSVMTDMFFVSRILTVNGRVVLRNIWSRPVRRAVMYYLKNLPYSLERVAPWREWVIKRVPVIGELLLRLTIRPLDLCVMRLTEKDTRPWNHFISF